MDRDAQSGTNAVNTVNTEEKDPTACVILTIAYFRGGEQATVRNRGGTYQIVKILVVGVVTETGLQAAMPQAFYTLFAIKEDEA